jgi:hypothetical protein
MKKIGKTDPTWSLAQAIQDQVEKESWKEWSKKPVATLKYDYRPKKLQLTETARHVFANSIHFITSLPKL